MPTATVVLGARTKLGQALLGASPVDASFRLVTRNRDDEAELSAQWPTASLQPAEASPWAPVDGCNGATIHVCALGLIHPDRPDWASHARDLQRDLGAIDRALHALRCPTHVVFVSSALALGSPRVERRYYAGLKLAAEGALTELVARHGHASLSVLYPGRLVTDEAGWPSRLLHTPFIRLAKRMIALAQRDPARRTIGCDARLLIALKSAQSSLRALLPG